MESWPALLEQASQEAVARHQAYLESLAPGCPFPPLRAEDLSPYCWVQTWPDTGLGFGGGAPGVTRALTCVFVCDGWSGAVSVYHGGRFAYFIRNPSEAFWAAMRAFHLPGAAEPWETFERPAAELTVPQLGAHYRDSW